MDKIRNLEIFKTALYIHEAGLIKCDGSSERKIYYLVTDPASEKEHSVVIELTENQVIKLTCSCTLAALKSKHLPICSHMMAAIRLAVYDLGRPRKKNA